MRIARFDRHATGIVLDAGGGTHVLDVAASLERLGPDQAGHRDLLRRLFAAPGPASWVPMIDAWEQVRPAFERLAGLARQGSDSVVLRPLEAVRLRPPIPAPTARAFALAANSVPHAVSALAALGEAAPPEVVERQMRGRKESGALPPGFAVDLRTVVGHTDAVSPPAGTRKLDYEAEVAVVFAGSTTSAPGSAALRVWGATAWNDLSIRDHIFGLGVDAQPRRGHAFVFDKNFDTGNACGPWLVVDEGLDHADLTIRLRVNGEQRQCGSTAEMVYGFHDAAERIASYLTLASGDMLVSGTVPGTAIEQGVDGPYLQAGDVVEVEVEGVGTLRNRIREPGRSADLHDA